MFDKMHHDQNPITYQFTTERKKNWNRCWNSQKKLSVVNLIYEYETVFFVQLIIMLIAQTKGEN